MTDYLLKLMQGDCLELMKDIPDGSVDLVLTGPPYGSTGVACTNAGRRLMVCKGMIYL